MFYLLLIDLLGAAWAFVQLLKTGYVGFFITTVLFLLAAAITHGTLWEKKGRR